MEQTTEESSVQIFGTLTVVVGLPGSGKSTYIKSLVETNPQLSVYDDYQGEAYDNDHDPRLSKHFGSLASDLKQAKHVVVSDIRYCVPYELNSFLAAILSVVPNVRIELKYFENNPKACRQNILARNREERVDKELELLDKLSDSYTLLTIEHLLVKNSS